MLSRAYRFDRILKSMSRKRKARDRGNDTVLTFCIAAIAGVAAAAVAEDIRYFAEGSPESFLRTWRMQPVAIFVGVLVYIAMLYLLQLLNDRERALKYVYPDLPLIVFSGINLAARLNPLWAAAVAVACFGGSILQVRFLRSGRSSSARL